MSTGGRGVLIAVAAFVAALALALSSAASAHFASIAAAPASCAGKADGSFGPPQVFTGEFGTEVEGGYVLVPFQVPAGTTAVRVRYCHDQPEAPTNSQIKHVLDLGIYDALGADGFFDEDEFRGWGGSSHPDVTISPNGFSDDATYVANPKQHVHGRTTRGFEPGPVPPGAWAVELGVAAVASQTEGDSDGKVAWRVEVETSTSGSWSSQPYQATPYDATPAQSTAGWYAGDFHVHAEHSSLGDATMRESFDYAFAPLPRDSPGCPVEQTGAGLDFITLSDYVSDSAWGEVGRFQPDYPGKLIVRSAEVITYKGHTNNHASVQYADYRTGPVYELLPHGALVLRRDARPASEIFDAVHVAGGFTQVNHPTIFPSQVPGFDFLCRGCPWDYTDAETDYSKVDASEIATGPAGLEQDPQPGPNPFTPTAIQFWEDAIDANGPNSNHIAAVGSSDSHKAGRTNDLPNIPSAPIGTATTAVYADELSERGIQRGVEAGHTYVKVWGNDGPDLRLTATDTSGTEPPAMMGDTLQAQSADFTARVIGAGPSAARPGQYELFVLKDGAPLLSAPVVGDDFTFTFPSVGLGRYRLQVQRGSAIEAVSSPIYLEPSPVPYPRPGGATPLRVPLVPAFGACTSPNATHVPPLALPSCSPSRLESSLLTTSAVGTGQGFVRFDAVPGDPLTEQDEADVRLRLSASDVRRASDGGDYAGDALVETVIRITDRANGGSGRGSGTVQDAAFSVPVGCTATASTATGSSCNLDTTLDALVPGFAMEGKRAVISAFSVRLLDAGPDGEIDDAAGACLPACGSGDESPFLGQGLFLP